jgi:hypothetical protein
MQLGATMAEFALVAPLLFLLVFGLIEFGRIMQINSTVAEAARQAARQAAANADPLDQPFGTPDYTKPCAGTVFTADAKGPGCLTSLRIRETVGKILEGGGLDPNPRLRDGATAQECIKPLSPLDLPLPGKASVCVMPAEGTGRSSYADCPDATASLGRKPKAGELGGRQVEWKDPLFKGGNGSALGAMPGCFLIQVTVVYTYQPASGLLAGVIGDRVKISSSSATLAEY